MKGITEIRRARKKKKWTIKRAAKVIGISPSYLAKLERREATPSLELLNRLVIVYSKDIYEDYLEIL